MTHNVHGPARMATSTESFDDVGRLLVAAQVAPGEELCLEKFIGYGWSAQRSRPALIDQVAGRASPPRS